MISAHQSSHRTGGLAKFGMFDDGELLPRLLTWIIRLRIADMPGPIQAKPRACVHEVWTQSIPNQAQVVSRKEQRD